MKKVGLFLGISLFCLGSYLVYLFEFKSYDVADAKVDAVAGEEYVITLSDGSKIILDEFGNLIRREDPHAAMGSQPDDRTLLFGLKEFKVNTVSNEKVKASKEKVEPAVVAAENTVAHKNVTSINEKNKTKQIKQKYEAAFKVLEEQSTARLYTLIDLAKKELNEKQAKKQKISYPYFYNKYTTAASDLEKQTDQFFYALTKSMQQELKANGMPSSIANAYTKEYESRKDKLRRELMKKAAGI
ncbi:hypothetical protein QWY14_07395 [Planococcus sp. N028]|uniref:Uncharacterized protein n=1 Tax=Planococcus shixiaomingii TaxID=3058393 RepID=A0ABT8N1R2_9BACL|nr:hypothetical protein [Planococcus sp. N028]MDN7241612.1 hypothetical protein [Planococcus sp. N028]